MRDREVKVEADHAGDLLDVLLMPVPGHSRMPEANYRFTYGEAYRLRDLLIEALGPDTPESLDCPEPSGEPMGLNGLVGRRMEPAVVREMTFDSMLSLDAFLDAIPAGMRVTFDRSDRA